MASLSQLYDKHAIASYDKQLCLAEVVGDRCWNADLKTGHLYFGDDLHFPIQVLGSQSDYDNTWLWAWANPESGLPSTLLRASQGLQQMAMSLGVPELGKPKFDLGDIDGHYIAAVASGLCESDCYYRAPYDDGAAFLLITEAPEVRQQADLSAHFIVSRVIDSISIQEISHKVACESYLTYKGFSFEYQGQTLFASSPHGESLTVLFDGENRIQKMESVVSPPIRPSKKRRWWNF